MQFPIVLVLLNRLGLLPVARLKASRRYVLLAIVIFAVVVTPGGDPISPLVMSAVMYALYEAHHPGRRTARCRRSRLSRRRGRG